VIDRQLVPSSASRRVVPDPQSMSRERSPDSSRYAAQLRALLSEIVPVPSVVNRTDHCPRKRIFFVVRTPSASKAAM